MILRIKSVLVAFGLLAVTACEGPAPASKVTAAAQVARPAPAAPVEAPGPAPVEAPIEAPEEVVEPPLEAPDGAAALAAMDENLARLAGLEVIEVGQMLFQAPEGSLNCYGPCPGFEDAVEAAREEAALRLAELTALAESVVATPAEAAPAACDAAAVDANLEALAALEIVEVWGLVEVAPANNPMCYNLPCHEDEVAAAEATCANAQALARIAAAAEAL